MSEISKEELMAFTESNSKSALALEKVADRLQDILHNQEKIIGTLTSDTLVNKISETVSAATLERLEQSNKEINETLTTKLPGTLMEKINNSDMAKDIEHFKLFIGATGLIIVIAVVVLKFLFGAPTLTHDQVKQIVSQYQNQSQAVTQIQPVGVSK